MPKKEIPVCMVHHKLPQNGSSPVTCMCTNISTTVHLQHEHWSCWFFLPFQTMSTEPNPHKFPKTHTYSYYTHTHTHRHYTPTHKKILHTHRYYTPTHTHTHTHSYYTHTVTTHTHRVT